MRIGLKSICYILLLLGCKEIGIGLLQLFKLYSSLHAVYPYTGSFYNPGPYACYLAVLLPVAIDAINRKDNSTIDRVASRIGKCIAITCIVLIPASLSRTALIASSLGLVCCYIKNVKKFIRTHKFSYIYIGFCLLIGIIIGLYYIKADSTKGRFLMWKLSIMTVKEVPSVGVGWENVAGAYGMIQERYFETGQRSECEILIADAPEYVFNEYFQVAIAFGLLVSLGIIALMAGGFIASFKNKEYGIAGSVASIAIVMMASYPLQFPLFTITIALILIAAYLSASSNALKIFGTVITILSCTLFLLNTDKTDIRSKFNIAHILHRQGNYHNSNKCLLDLTTKSSDPMILNIIGKNYQALGMPDSAEYYFRKSTFRCPNRMYPHYLLMKLYADSVYFNKTKCLNEANTILTMRVKIPSPAVDEMQHEAKLMINKM